MTPVGRRRRRRREEEEEEKEEGGRAGSVCACVCVVWLDTKTRVTLWTQPHKGKISQQRIC